MIKVKNVRPGILIIADAELKLAPGETADVESISVQMERCLADGLLTQVDVEPEAKPKSKSSSRNATSKTESKGAADQPSAADASSSTQASDSGQGQLIEDNDGNS